MEEAVLLNDRKAKTYIGDTLIFKYLPGYAKFIRENCLIPYIQEQLRISREINFPILKFFEGIPDDKLIEIGVPSHTEFLVYAEENRLKIRITESIDRWIADDLIAMKREDLTAEDLIDASYVCKKALLNFLPRYCNDVTTAIEIISEIDRYCLAAETASSNVYLDLLKERINKQSEKEREIAARLAYSEQALQKAQEISQTGNWTWDLATNKIEWSDTLYNIYGIPVGTELEFDYIISFNEPAHNAIIKENLKGMLKTLQPSETYFTITLQNGNKKILYSKAEVVTGAEKQAEKVLGIIQDVTQQQQLVNKLQRSEELYREGQAISHIGNWTIDMDTNVIRWSDELYRIYGLEPQSVPPRTILGKYLHPEDRAFVSDAMQQMLEGYESVGFYYRIITENGITKTLQYKGKITTDNDKPVKAYGTVQDVTEQKLSERQLKEYKEFIEKITNVTPSLITSYNIHTGKYSYCNNAIEKLLGYPVSRIMDEGAPFFTAIIHPDDLPVMTEKNTRALEEANQLAADAPEPIAEVKYRMKTADGHYRWFRTYSTVFERNDKGMVESMLNISIDVTEQERAERELFKKNLQLQQSNKSLEEYAFVTSHDLKEPLRKIATFSDRLLSAQQSALNAEGKLYLNKIISSAKRMQHMINDLLKVSTIMGNKAYEQCDLNTLLEEAMMHLDHKIEECKAVVESDKLPSVSVVPSQFRQLFQNLISNSLKFARPDVFPHIRIQHSYLTPKEVEHLNLEHLSVSMARRYLQIRFADNGIGFDNEYAAKIFALFQRLHGKTEYEGTGIGLSVCEKIMENHAGVIFATGVVDEGATFTIIFPVYQG